jgi:hypothetical protein
LVSSGPIVDQQYSKLSEAVHASSVDFRMTEDGTGMSLWRTDTVHESRWESHERKTLQGLNLLMLTPVPGTPARLKADRRPPEPRPNPA